MAIQATDIRFCLSGGAANADPDDSFGGAISATEIGAGLHNLFDLVTGRESASGKTDYRCIYVKNAHFADTFYNAVLYIEVESPSPDTDIAVGVGASATGGTEQQPATENAAPTGVVFSKPMNIDDGAILLGDIPPGSHRAVWIRRVTVAGASAFNSDGMTIAVTGDTAA